MKCNVLYLLHVFATQMTHRSLLLVFHPVFQSLPMTKTEIYTHTYHTLEEITHFTSGFSVSSSEMVSSSTSL